MLTDPDWRNSYADPLDSSRPYRCVIPLGCNLRSNNWAEPMVPEERDHVYNYDGGQGQRHYRFAVHKVAHERLRNYRNRGSDG